jgi:hypothetical protein
MVMTCPQRHLAQKILTYSIAEKTIGQISSRSEKVKAFLNVSDVKVSVADPTLE